jgi:HEPN/Toprim N-terminal domain 1
VSSYANLYIGGAEVFSWRNEVEPTFLFLYTDDDVHRVPIAADEIWDETVRHYIVLSSTASVLAERLDALGIGMAAVDKEFDERIDEKLQSLSTVRASVGSDELENEIQNEIQLLENLTVAGWVDLVRMALKPDDRDIVEKRRDPKSLTSLLDIWERSDSRVLLRVVLLACEPEEEITLDLTDLITGGWMDEPSDPQRAAMDALGYALANGSPPVVITEGSTDARILQSAIRIRYPHLESFIKFFDFTTDAEGSAAAGVRTLKSFVAAGISNRVVLLLDNDSAAKDAVRGLRSVELPDHYSVMHYPDLDLARDYPTLGPNGLSNMDVNGLAGSIELYLGEDVLRDSAGALAPVQWRSYIEGVKAYQGEVMHKVTLQKRFEDKVRRARADDGSAIAGQDWSGLEAIIEELLKTLRG